MNFSLASKPCLTKRRQSKDIPLEIAIKYYEITNEDMIEILKDMSFIPQGESKRYINEGDVRILLSE